MDGKKLGRDAYQLALRHGATDEKIQALMNRDALLTILQEANIEADICEDVADACDINDLDALIFASGLLSVNDVADACFLTKDEAEVCPSPLCKLPAFVAVACREACERCSNGNVQCVTNHYFGSYGSIGPVFQLIRHSI